MKKVISLLIVVALMLPVLCVPVTAVEHSTVEYIVENVDLLAEAYELLKPDAEEVFAGEYVERMIPVEIISTDLPGTYIDFNGENGYMVVQDDSAVIAWEVSGDLEYLQELEATYYSVIDGFLYIENGNYVPYETNQSDSEDMIQGTPYGGQEAAGDGDIRNIADYVSGKYPGYVLQESDNLNYYFEYVNQYYLSVYYTYDEYGNYLSEGNCSLSSVYALLNYLGSSGYCDFPTSSEEETHYAHNDSFYSLFYGDPTFHIEPVVELPELYYSVRYWANRDYGYQVSGFSTANIPGLIETVASEYTNSIDATLHLLGSFDSCVVPGIGRDTPVILCVSGSETYGNHAIVVTGYNIYKKTTTVLGIPFYDYLYILRVNDNWSYTARYFDLKAYGGISSYITVEVND